MHGEPGDRRQKAWAHCEVLRILLREESEPKEQKADTFTNSEVTANAPR